MTRKTLSTPIGHLAKPSALRHATRVESKRKHHRDAKPDWDSREACQWIDRHGKFTIPHTKE